MGRVRLNSLLDDAKSTLESAPHLSEQVQTTAAVAEPAAAEPAVAEPDAPAREPEETPVTPAADAHADKPPRRSAPRREKPAPGSDRVHYASLVRKEARLRDDQVESLTLRARRLSRNKVGTDQRITDNTLIRVAVDLLLAREADLAGSSEAELRKSVGL